MITTNRIAKGSLLFVLIGLIVGCFVEPREGFYDRDHHRYYHEHGWHECAEHNEFCR